MADDDSGAPEKRREPPPIEFLKPGETQAPPPAEQGPVAWVTRPEEYQQPRYPQAPAPPRTGPPGSGSIPRIGGALLLLAAVFGMSDFLLSSLTPLTPAQYQSITNDTAVYALSQICGLVATWGQAVTIVSGTMAILRVNWKFSVGTALFGMIGLVAAAAVFEDPYVIGSGLLVTIGFLLVVASRRQFLS